MKMKKSIFSATALAVLTRAAFAADLASHKEEALLPPSPPSPPTWTGFYVGLNAGATWANSSNVRLSTYRIYAHPAAIASQTTNLVSSVMGSPNISTGTTVGFMGGGQFGYSYQINSNLVVGGEADIQGVAGSNGRGGVFDALDFSYVSEGVGRTVATNYAAASAQKSLDYLGTVRAKVGYLITPGLQIYGTGGFAYGGVSMGALSAQDLSSPRVYEVNPGGANYSGTLVGWTAGGGLEWMFATNWSVKAEYLCYDLGSKQLNVGQLTRVWNGSVPGPYPAGTILSQLNTRASSSFNGNVARVGVNYHFNLGAAQIVARF